MTKRQADESWKEQEATLSSGRSPTQVDLDREIRSMVMATFPALPMPLMASAASEESAGESRQASSHDLIAR